MILKFFKNIWRVVKSTLLCIRFPFLYPRNRFTGNHYDCWKIIEYHRSNYIKANFFFTIDLINEDRKDEVRELYKYIDNIYLRSEHSGTELIIIKGPKEKIIKRIDLGSEIYYSGWVNGNLVVKVEDLEKNKSSRFVNLCINPWLNWKIKFLDWVNDYPLQLLHLHIFQLFCIVLSKEADFQKRHDRYHSLTWPKCQQLSLKQYLLAKYLFRVYLLGLLAICLLPLLHERTFPGSLLEPIYLFGYHHRADRTLLCLCCIVRKEH